MLHIHTPERFQPLVTTMYTFDNSISYILAQTVVLDLSFVAARVATCLMMQVEASSSFDWIIKINAHNFVQLTILLCTVM